MTDAETPSDKLAAATVEHLIEAGLVRADQKDRVTARIAAGRMSSEDWKTELDLAALKADAK